MKQLEKAIKETETFIEEDLNYNDPLERVFENQLVIMESLYEILYKKPYQNKKEREFKKT